jgi:hypothetical protein
MRDRAPASTSKQHSQRRSDRAFRRPKARNATATVFERGS